MTARALQHQPGIGRKSIAEIREALAVFGMRLLDDGEPPEQQELPIDGSGRATRGSAEPLRNELGELVRSACEEEKHTAVLILWLGFDGSGGVTTRAAAIEHDLRIDALRALRASVQQRLRDEAPVTRASIVRSP